MDISFPLLDIAEYSHNSKTLQIFHIFRVNFLPEFLVYFHDFSSLVGLHNSFF